MYSDPLAPRNRRRDRGNRSFRSLLFTTRAGQLVLLLAALRVLGAFGLVPPILTTAATIGLWTAVVAIAIWALAPLRRKLLWRIRRKLIISYLLIGLVPTVLILSFFLIGSFFIVGQLSSYMLNTAVQRVEADVATTAELAFNDVEALSRAQRYIPEVEILEVLSRRVAGRLAHYPGSGAIYLEHRRGRIQRVVTTDGFTESATVGTPLPVWLETSFRGPVSSRDELYIGASSSPMPSREEHTVLVLVPFVQVLDSAATSVGFHIDQVFASQSGDGDGDGDGDSSGFAEVPLTKTARPETDALNLTLPWATLLSPRSLDETTEDQRVLVRFGFPLSGLYYSVASNALSLGPGGADLGRIILLALVLLGAVFLVIEFFAIFVGLVLARSITSSVHALSQGTERVRQGDFGYKVQVRSRDQLGELADSFNLMTTSIQDLLRQSAEKERLEEELRIAREIQMSLLPKDRVSVPGLAIAALCLPATEVGGDYYDYISLPDGRLALLIADVSGKGTSAALYMAELKGLVLSLSQIYDSPRKLLVEANKILSANLDSRSFITMAYAVIDMKRRQMTYARAGHNPLYQLVANSGRARTRVWAPDGLGLALDRGTHFERILKEQTIELSTNDMFLFYTDGVSEAMNSRSELFGEERLKSVMEENAELSVDELREKMVDEVFAFAGGAVQHDDMTIVLMKVL